MYSKAYGKGTVTEIKGIGKAAVVTIQLADPSGSMKFLLANYLAPAGAKFYEYFYKLGTTF